MIKLTMLGGKFLITNHALSGEYVLWMINTSGNNANGNPAKSPATNGSKTCAVLVINRIVTVDILVRMNKALPGSGLS